MTGGPEPFDDLDAGPQEPLPRKSAASPSDKMSLTGPSNSPGRSGHLQDLAARARDYAKASSSDNTRKAYAADWRHYSAWARRQNLPALPPDPQVIGLYIAACASGTGGGGKPKSSVGTIERRLSALMWNFAQRGQPMDRKDRHVATVLAGIRRTQGRPPEQKEALLPEAPPGDDRDPRSRRSAWPARPGDPPPRLRRRPAPLGNRRPRLPPRGRPRAAAGSNFSTTACC